MRELLINRLIELTIFHSGFPKNTMRWESTSFNGVYLRNIKFTKEGLEVYSDDELLDLYKLIIVRASRQM